jgi:hypothetical protein
VLEVASIELLQNRKLRLREPLREFRGGPRQRFDPERRFLCATDAGANQRDEENGNRDADGQDCSRTVPSLSAPVVDR